MRLEGTLDAFSLPDIFQLLSYTKKTGTLHLRREGQHGVVHLRDGAVTGGRGDVTCQALGRRLVGAGLVDDESLADAVEKVLDQPGSGLAKAIAETGRLDPGTLCALAAEQATDAVFELLRWPDGDFAFVVDEADPDDLGAALPVEDVVAEGNRRLETWATLTEQVPSASAIVSLAPAQSTDPVLSRHEWALLSLVDGNRSVGELVTLTGTGEYVVVSALAGLTERGLVVVGERPEGAGALAQRQELLAALERGGAAADVPDAPAPASTPAERRQVIPDRPEPFTPTRQPEHPESPLPALTRLAAGAAMAKAGATPAATASAPDPGARSAGVGSVHGAHALQPDASPAPSSYIDRDPSVNKSLLLRLIAGVRGL
ncbi:MAG: hypothetical protein JWM02_366 [Frankiales bacterium]|nr:hypothetical protein [Frankiales bacterium]